MKRTKATIDWEDCKNCNTEKSVEVRVVLCNRDFTIRKTWTCRRCRTKTTMYPDIILNIKAGIG